jgi:hypothetical protein
VTPCPPQTYRRGIRFTAVPCGYTGHDIREKIYFDLGSLRELMKCHVICFDLSSMRILRSTQGSTWDLAGVLADAGVNRHRSRNGDNGEGGQQGWCTHTHTHTLTHTHTHTHKHTQTHTHTHTYKQTHIYTHTHTNRLTHTHTHTYTHTHTHTHRRNLLPVPVQSGFYLVLPVVQKSRVSLQMQMPYIP